MLKFFKSPLGIIILVALAYFGYMYYKKMQDVKRSAFRIVTDPDTMNRVQQESVATGKSVSQVIAERTANMSEALN